MKDSSHPSLQRFLNVLNPVRGFGTSFKDRVWSGRRRGVGLLAFPHCGLEKSGPVMGMRLFHLHNMLGIRPFSPIFRFLQSFRWRASWLRPFPVHSVGTSRNKNRFLWYSLKTRHQPFPMAQPKKFEPRREVRWRGLGTCWISRGRVLREGEGRRKSLSGWPTFSMITRNYVGECYAPPYCPDSFFVAVLRIRARLGRIGSGSGLCPGCRGRAP